MGIDCKQKNFTCLVDVYGLGLAVCTYKRTVQGNRAVSALGASLAVAAFFAQPMESANAAAPTHLVVLVNGIWGGVWDWKRFMERALAHPAAGAVLVHASLVNSALATGDGESFCVRVLGLIICLCLMLCSIGLGLHASLSSTIHEASSTAP